MLVKEDASFKGDYGCDSLCVFSSLEALNSLSSLATVLSGLLPLVSEASL